MTELSPADRVMKVKDALWFAQEKIPHFVVQETGIAAYEALKGIIPALLASLAFVTLTTVIGAGAGAAVGSLGFGLGAVPFGIAGGTVGFKTGLWILNIVGLAFLIEHLGSSLWVAVRHIEEGILIAWGPKSEKDSSTLYDGDAIKAGERIALGVAVIIRCIIEAIAIYLTVRGIAKLPELVANLKRSKLGEGFAVWVEQNHLKILNNPKLNISAGAGGAAQKPAKVLDHTNVPEQPQAGAVQKNPPPLRQKYEGVVRQLSKKAEVMRKDGYAEEEIARALHAERRALGVEYKNLTPPELLERIYNRNLEKYGDPLGPSIDYLRSRGKTWEQITESACRPGGKDLGY